VAQPVEAGAGGKEETGTEGGGSNIPPLPTMLVVLGLGAYGSNPMEPVEFKGTIGGADVDGRTLPGCTGLKPNDGSLGLAAACPKAGAGSQAIVPNTTDAAMVIVL